MSLDLPLTLYLLCTVVAVISFGVFLPAVLCQHIAPFTIVCAATLGAGADVLFRSLGDTFDITVYGAGAQWVPWFIIVPLIICFVVGLYLWHPPKPSTSPQMNPLYGVSIGAVGFLYFTLLGYPNTVARWVEGSYWLTAVLSGAAVSGFVLVSHTRARTWLTSGKGIVAGSIALLAAVTACVIAPLPGVVVLCSIALFFLPLHFYHVAYRVRGTTINQIASLLGVAAVVFVSFVLLSVFSLTYAYVPGMHILRDKISVIILAASVMTLFVFIYRGSPLEYTKNRILTAALSILIIAGIWSGAAIYQSHPVTDTTIVVMTYNIQQGFNTEGKINPWQLLEPIQQVNPSILGLQESDTDRISSTNIDIVQWLAHKLDMYAYFGPETRQQTFGVALLSTFPLYNTETYYLTSIGEQTVLVRADILVNNEPLSIYVTHLGETEKDRTQQTAEILEILSKNTNRKILMGDFNSLPDSEQMKAFTTVVHDAWTYAGHSLLDPRGNTSSTLTPEKRIDYILVSEGLYVITCDVIRDVYGSDHLPVWAEIEG
jgi:endonuclease/exonuclease/phosphatase family metal-dependent hydrolase